MLSRSARSVLPLVRPSLPLRLTRQPRQSLHQLSKLSHPLQTRRHFHLSPRTAKGLQPHSEDPKPPEAHVVDDGGIRVREPAKISVDEYHEIADEYVDGLVATLEEKAETPGSGFDVEYSVRCSKNPPKQSQKRERELASIFSSRFDVSRLFLLTRQADRPAS